MASAGKLKKEMTLFGVFAVGTGTTLSAGFFLLPGLAFAQSGPAVVLAYLIAAVMMIAERAADLILGNTPLVPDRAKFYRHDCGFAGEPTR